MLRNSGRLCEPVRLVRFWEHSTADARNLAPAIFTTRRSLRKEIIGPFEKYGRLFAIPDTATTDLAGYFHVALLGH